MSKKTGALALAVLLILSGCDSQREQDDFAEQASRPASGITRITEDREVLETDADDWRVAPFRQGEVRVEPAYPNPVNDDLISLEITIPFGTDIQALQLSRRVPGTIQLSRIATEVVGGNAGVYVFTFSPAEFPTAGLHRIFVFDERNELVTYGDILVE